MEHNDSLNATQLQHYGKLLQYYRRGMISHDELVSKCGKIERHRAEARDAYNNAMRLRTEFENYNPLR